MKKNKKSSEPSSKQRTVKIGQLTFKPEIKKLEKLYPQLRTTIIENGLNNSLRRIRNKSQDSFLQPQTLMELVLESSHDVCSTFPPSMILHIEFHNLVWLNVEECRLYNIEILTFIKSNFVSLKSLNMGNEFGASEDCDDNNMVRSIQPLVKIQMPQLHDINFDCGEMNCMGRVVSRMKTSKEMSNVHLELDHDSDYWLSDLRDEDLSIWLKLEAEKLGHIEKLIMEDMFDVNRIKQPKVQACLKRKYGKVLKQEEEDDE